MLSSVCVSFIPGVTGICSNFRHCDSVLCNLVDRPSVIRGSVSQGAFEVDIGSIDSTLVSERGDKLSQLC